MDNFAAKTPAEVKDYEVDWSGSLGTGEEIATSTFTVTSGDGALTVNSPAPTISSGGLSTVVWLAGGTAAQNYVVTNTVTTTNAPPRTMQESFAVLVSSINIAY